MERKDKEKRKKKKEKTKLLLGCVTVPSSNDESYAMPGVDPGVDAASTIAAAAAALSDADDKKAEKRRKKLAKIAARNEKKELKKREKLNKKLGKLELEGEGNSAEKKTEKKAKKKSKNLKNQLENIGGGAPTSTQEGKLTSIGDDSVVVVELPLEDHVKTAVLNGTTDGGEATTRCGAMELLKKKKKKKRKAEDEVQVDGDCKKKKKKRKKDKENLDEGKADDNGVDASVAVDPSVKNKEKKKSKKKSESVALNDSIDSTNVSALMSPAPPPLPSCPPPSTDVSSSVVQAKKKKSKKRDESSEIAPLAKAVTDVAPTTEPHSSVNNSSSKDSGEIISTPIAPERPSKKQKKSKALRDAEASAGSDVDTPTKAIKSDLITELKTKVKDRKKSLATPSPLPDAKTVTKAADGDDQVFATPTKVASDSAAPARVAMGQWGKVELGSTEKTQKFFRLLGGMKKPTGSPLSFRSSKGSNSTVDGGGTPETEKAIMAMGKKDADILNNKLEEQFKKALGGIGKGKVGLGFSPQLDPANKKFHIDVNATNSVKF